MLKRSFLVVIALIFVSISIWFMGLNKLFFLPVTGQSEEIKPQKNSTSPIEQAPSQILEQALEQTVEEYVTFSANATKMLENMTQSNASLKDIAPLVSDANNEPSSNKVKQNKKPQAALDLALEQIDLIQGEGGFELWQLKASWANIRKTDGLLIVSLPKLEYFLQNEEANLFITAITGEIDSDNQLLFFLDDVVATYKDTVIKGPLLLFDGTKNTMEFQNNSTVHSLDFSGSAHTIIWNMQTKTIVGQGQVQVHFDGDPTKTP